MFSLIIKRLLNRKLVSALMLFALLCIYVLIPAGTQYIKETELTVDTVIEKYGRGSYDLLVRPAGSRTSVEKKLGVVEENYIGDSRGGISIKGWRKIQKEADIQVAAPVASLGYFSGRKVSVEFPKLSHPARFTWQFYTSDGVRQYPLDQKNILTYFDGSKPGYTEYIKYPMGQEQLTGNRMLVMLPAAYHLLAAIDVESEKKLTGIDYSALNRSLGEDEFKVFNQVKENLDNPPAIKVLQREDIQIPLHLSLAVDQLDVSLDFYKQKLGLNKGQILLEAYNNDDETLLKETAAQLKKEKALKTKKYDFDLSSFEKPFEGAALTINPQFQLEESNDAILDYDTSSYYTADKIKYEMNDSLLSVKIAAKGSPPSYKTVKQKGISTSQANLEGKKVPFLVVQTGTFSSNSNLVTQQLVSSPLGVYTTSKVKDENGKQLTPTTIPGSFIPAPASGVTTIESAELIKGNKPIDAIRIRVAGITSYNKQAKQKIEKVAKRLLLEGYEVDIVAGASFKNQKLEAEGIGKVSEPWTTLGVAQSIQSNWSIMTILTLSLFALFGLLWLSGRLIFERNAVDSENELLLSIGWEKNRIFQKNMGEQALLMTAAFLAGLPILFLFHPSAVSYSISLGLWLFSLLTAFILYRSKTKKKQRSESYRCLASFRYYGHIILPVALVLTVSAILLLVEISTLGHTLSEMKKTALGGFTFTQTQSLQAVLALITLILTIVSVTEGLNTLFIHRKDEFNMYQIIGWKKRTIIKHLMKELSIWISASLFLGLLAGTLALILLNISLLWITIGILTTAFMIIISIFIIIIARKY